jgi:hypothetical protein
VSALCIEICVAVNEEELPYIPFPRERSMRTGRKPRDTHATPSPPTLLSRDFPAREIGFPSMVCHVAFQVVVGKRKLKEIQISGN